MVVKRTSNNKKSQKKTSDGKVAKRQKKATAAEDEPDLSEGEEPQFDDEENNDNFGANLMNDDDDDDDFGGGLFKKVGKKSSSSAASKQQKPGAKAAPQSKKDGKQKKGKAAKHQQLEEEEDDENGDGAEFGMLGDEGDEGDDDLLPIERQAKVDAQEQAEEDEDAESEMKSNLQKENMEAFKLPSEEDLANENEAGPQLPIVKQRIQDVLFVLSDFKNHRQPERSRAEYLDQLKNDMASYYGYLPELMELFLALFSPAEAMEFLEANEAQRPLTIRANTLKTRRRDLAETLINRGVNLDPVGEWTKVGLKIYDSQVPVGATPEYLAGHYMLQSAASFLPVMALGPQENEKILDMCAAPGGKTSYIAALMKNSGVLVANDFNKHRIPALVANLARLGVRNAAVVNYDGRKMGTHFGSFDRILLDAPCSGLGVISRDPSIKLQKTVRDVMKCSHLQKELILSAIDLLVVGGTLVYSTCSISVEENEDVVDYALRHRYVKLQSTGLPFGVKGMCGYRGKQYHPTVVEVRRFYPHVQNMDGFFVSKFTKFMNGAKTTGENNDQDAELGLEGEEEASDIEDGSVDDDNGPSTTTTTTPTTTAPPPPPPANNKAGKPSNKIQNKVDTNKENKVSNKGKKNNAEEGTTTTTTTNTHAHAHANGGESKKQKKGKQQQPQQPQQSQQLQQPQPQQQQGKKNKKNKNKEQQEPIPTEPTEDTEPAQPQQKQKQQKQQKQKQQPQQQPKNSAPPKKDAPTTEKAPSKQQKQPKKAKGKDVATEDAETVQQQPAVPSKPFPKSILKKTTTPSGKNGKKTAK